MACSATRCRNFYPRPPRGGRREGHCAGRHTTDISIHALREEGDLPHSLGGMAGHISIHALREEGDISTWQNCDLRGISIHALREEGDPFSSFSTTPRKEFLSTPSARRATALFIRLCRVCQFLSTPSARRAT